MHQNESESLIYYRHNTAGNALSIAAGKINFYELTLILNGTMTYTINDRTLSVKSGDMLFLPPDTRRYRPATDAPVDYVSFNFYSTHELSLPTHASGIVSSEIRMLIRACDEMKRRYYESAHPMIFAVLNGILLLLSLSLKVKKQSPMVSAIQEYLKSNLNAPLRLKEIAETVSYSPAYCDTLFKRETGSSINEYLVNLRINEAKALLIENELSLKQIAEAVGYIDYNYFARLFKKRTGLTPSAYNKKNYVTTD